MGQTTPDFSIYSSMSLTPVHSDFILEGPSDDDMENLFKSQTEALLEPTTLFDSRHRPLEPSPLFLQEAPQQHSPMPKLTQFDEVWDSY